MRIGFDKGCRWANRQFPGSQLKKVGERLFQGGRKGLFCLRYALVKYTYNPIILQETTLITTYQEIIGVEPGKRAGKPCIRGMRITVYDVLSYLAAGMSHPEILTDFPELTEEDILACLSYAADREQHTLVAHG